MSGEPTTTVQAAVPPPPPPPEPAPRVRKRRRRRSGVAGFVTDKAIPLLIAFLGLVATLATTYGAIVTADINDLEDKRSSLENEVDSLTDENAALGEEVETVTDENNELREEVEAASSESASGSDDSDDGNTTTGVTTPTPGRTSSVLRETGGTPVTFSSGYSIDVDSPAPDWGVSRDNGDLYFSCCRPHLYTSEVSLVDHVPTEAECDDATLLQGSLGADQTRVGTQFCMRTYEDRFVYVHIVAIDEEAETITLDLIVWK